MDLKEATRTAREYVTAVFADEEITQLGLEEVMYDVDSEQWRITFGFALPWDQQNTVAVRMGLKTPRAYKVVHVNNGDGSIAALTDHLLPETKVSENAQGVSPTPETAASGDEREIAEVSSGKPKSGDAKWDKVLRLIGKITNAASGGVYVFRGEAKYYPEVCSGLYRELRNAVKAGYPLEPFAEADLNDAKLYTGTNDDWEVLSHIQHYEGVTNLVDFTTDVNVALFFACDGHYRKDGRIIILERKCSETLKFHEPEDPADRAPAQRSVLVRPVNGVVAGGRKVIVPGELKQRMMEYLYQYHGINHGSVYSGYHGFIKFRQRRWEAFTPLDDGLECFNRKEYDAAINHLSAAIDHLAVLNTFKAMDVSFALARAYQHRAMSYQFLCNAACAEEDFDKARKLDPDILTNSIKETLQTNANKNDNGPELPMLGGVVKRVCSRSSLPGAGRWPNTTPFSWHSGSPPRATA